MNSFLLTGANGFIGKHLIKYLEEQLSPFLKNILLAGSKFNQKYETILTKNYLFSSSALRNKNIISVLHLGAFTPKQSSEANLLNNTTSNITSTLSLLENLPKTVKKFVFISTLDVYGETNKVINESLEPNPVSLYGLSKLYCERMVEEWGKKNNNIIQILRIGHVYGAGEEKYKKIIPVTINKVINNIRPQIYSDGSELRSFIHVTDCVRLILKSLELNKYDGPINITSSKSITISKLVNIIIKQSNKDITAEFLNKTENIRNLRFNNSKMVKYLGDETISLENGLLEEYNYIKIFKNHEQT